MENCPEPKMMITARAVNISGAAASMIFPILRREVNGPIKKLVMAVIGSSLTSSTIRETSAQAMKMISASFTASTNRLIFLLLFMARLPNFFFCLFLDTQHIGSKLFLRHAGRILDVRRDPALIKYQQTVRQSQYLIQI